MVVTFALHGILVMVQESVAEFISVGSRAGMEITRPLTTRPMLELDRMGQLLRWDLAKQMEFQKKTLKVMYIFAGKRRQSDVGSSLRAAEKAGQFNLILKEIDIEHGPEHGLRDQQIWDSIFTELQQGDWFFIVSCNSFSRAGFQYRKHPVVEDEHPGSIWQWDEVHDLCVVTFAIHQCQFGAIYPKPTRLLTNAAVSDSPHAILVFPS